jgi:hypothetical protein
MFCSGAIIIHFIRITMMLIFGLIIVVITVESNFHDSRQSVIDEETESNRDLDSRFRNFVRVICEKCMRRKVYCGCDLGMSNPPFETLRKYSQSYINQKQKISNFEPQDRQWVVVDLSAGFGNQLLTLVNGLQLALMTDRILIIRHRFSPNHHGVVASMLDSVVPWMSTLYIEQHDVKLGPERVIDLWTKSGLEFLICKNWTEQLREFPTLRLPHGVQDVHLSHANWAFGDALRATFRSLDFFFLSHFFWSGRQELSLTVRAETLPRPQPWDGARPLSALIRDLRAARPARLIGVHVRIASNHFCIIDTVNYPEEIDPALGNASLRDAPPSATDFCFSSSLASVSACLRRIVDAPRGDAAPAVVLWAADSDSLSADLLHATAALPGVRVVRLRHAADARYDADPRAALLDLLLLTEADALVAAAWSTYSYAAHARGPYTPHYPAFRPPGAPGAPCAPAAGPEAGLLGVGPGFDECAHAGPAQLVCRAWRAECTTALMGDGATGCIESLLREPCCPAGAAAALRAAVAPHAGGFDAARLLAQVHAKHGRAIVPANGARMAGDLPECPPTAARVRELVQRFRDRTAWPV